jgi:hypothetical protein
MKVAPHRPCGRLLISMSGCNRGLSANREAPVDHELTVANMQVGPVPICVASPGGALVMSQGWWPGVLLGRAL